MTKLAIELIDKINHADNPGDLFKIQEQLSDMDNKLEDQERVNLAFMLDMKVNKIMRKFVHDIVKMTSVEK